MPIGIIEKLREAVIASPIVENYIKEMLKACGFNMLTNTVELSLHVIENGNRVNIQFYQKDCWLFSLTNILR